MEKGKDVLTWCNSLDNKKNLHFIQFDICEFYPSITEKLLTKAIEWADRFSPIPDGDKEVILAATNYISYNNGEPWKKKECENFFDLTMVQKEVS